MGTGPIPASRKALEKSGWKVKDLDLVEANEAFAAQALAVNKDMGWDPAIVNVNGGAIAIGHPIGASGARVLVNASARDAAPRRKKGPGHALHRRRHGHCPHRRAVIGRMILCVAQIDNKRLCVNQKTKGTKLMARVAVVSGGTRGIGAAISKALQAAGYTVAANYAGNDAAAAKFKAETGIPVYKWDVSNYKACAEGLAKVSHEIGPVDILVNNAGNHPRHHVPQNDAGAMVSRSSTPI